MDEPNPIALEAPEDPCPHCGQAVGDAWLVCAWCGTQIAAPAELEVGATLADGRYQVLGIIGRGGFGITYEVGDTRLKRRVAVKELFPESAVRHGSMVLTPPHARAAFRSSRDRFLREARVLARFTHPGIVRVYEVFEEHGTAYLVMEMLGGRTLVDVMRSRNEPFTEAEVLDVAGRVSAALRPVHAAGVLHRDVNPSNVMLTEHGRIVVIDFGLARDFDQDHTQGMTRMVTPGYAPLEQYRGEGRFGPTTDVYGLAATCYRLATGRVPVAAIERDAGAELPAPHRLNPAISKPVSDALLDGLELEPAHRPQDLDSLLARLGVRRLPDSPRSILLGAPGATAEDLAGDRPDAAAFGLDDPGPAVRPAGAGAASAVAAGVGAAAGAASAVSSRTGAATEVVSPAAGAAALGAAEAVPAAGGAGDGEPASRLLTELVDRPAPEGLTDPDLTAPAASRTVDRLDSTAPAGGGDGSDEERTWVPRPLDDETYAQGADLRGADERLGAASARDRPRLDRAGRGKVTLPLAAVAIATGSAAPVIVAGIIVLVVLPLLATIGDWVARDLRTGQGTVGGWAERSLPSALWLPVRFVRNIGVSIVRTSPVIGVGAVLLAAWYAFSQTSLPVGWLDFLLRVIGGGTVAALLLTSREGTSRFRTGMGIDELVARGAPDGRTTERLVVGWILAVVVIAAALWLTPDAFPLP